MTRIHKHKRDNNLVVLHEILQEMADNGETITQEKVIDEIKAREIKGLGTTTVKNLWKHFKPSIQAYKKGLSNEIILDKPAAKTNIKNIDMEKLKINDIDFEDDAMDVGKEILKNPNSILNPDPETQTIENKSLSDEQRKLIFKRVYSQFPSILRDDRVKERLYSKFLTKLEGYDSKEKGIICMNPETITDGEIFAKQFSLESQLQNLCTDLYNEV